MAPKNPFRTKSGQSKRTGKYRFESEPGAPEAGARDSLYGAAEESFVGRMSSAEEVEDARGRLGDTLKDLRSSEEGVNPEITQIAEKMFQKMDQALESFQRPETGVEEFVEVDLSSVVPESEKSRSTGAEMLPVSDKFVDVPLDNPSSLQKAPPSLYLKAMDFLIKSCDNLGLKSASRYLKDVKYKEEVVLPKIDKLVKDCETGGKLSEQQIKNTFEDLLTREDNADVDLNQKEVKDKIKAMSELELPADKKQARRKVLQAFADVSALKGEGDLAKTCKWSAMRPVLEKAQNIGKEASKRFAKATGREQKGPRQKEKTGERQL